MKRLAIALILAFVTTTLLFANIFGDGNLTFSFQDFPELGEMGRKWGDCTIIEFPNGEIMVLDTAIKACSGYLVEHLNRLGIERIDYLVVSHMHSDHYGGVAELTRKFDIGAFYWSGYCSNEETWVVEIVEAAGIPVHKLSKGDVLEIGGVTIEVLYPSRETLDGLPVMDSDSAMILLNNNSLIMRFDYGCNSALFVGDVYKTEEEKIISCVDPEKLDVDLLKVPHHGHDTSSGKNFIAATTPSYAVMMGNIVMQKVIYYRYFKQNCVTYASWMNGVVNVSFTGSEILVDADDLSINEYYSF